MITLGLTGSIGMGKSTTAQMFAKAGVPVWDADATVHALYAAGGAGAQALGALYPQAVGPDGVDRNALKALISKDNSVLKQIEGVIHPLVAASRQDFLREYAQAPVVLFDIPLLFETGADAWLDKVVVVTAPADVQKTRVLERGTMDEATFNMILSKQMPDTEKRARADFVIDTSQGLETAQVAVSDVLAQLKDDNHGA